MVLDVLTFVLTLFPVWRVFGNIPNRSTSPPLADASEITGLTRDNFEVHKISKEEFEKNANLDFHSFNFRLSENALIALSFRGFMLLRVASTDARLIKLLDECWLSCFGPVAPQPGQTP